MEKKLCLKNKERFRKNTKTERRRTIKMKKKLY